MHRSIVDKFAGPIGALLAPPRCRLCGAPTDHAPACAACRRTLPWNENACRACAIPLAAGQSGVCGGCLNDAPPQDASWAAFRYAAPVAEEIVRLKFHRDLAPSHLLGWLMALRLARRPEPLPELLIPVPLHTGRLRRRGYNQAVEIGRHLARHLAIRLDPDVTRRRQATREQTELSAVERRRNVRGAFTVGAAVAGRHIALLDDVVTTGATVAELARTARRAGAARIEVWAAARA